MRHIILLLLLSTGCSADHYASKGKAALDGHDLPAAEGHYRAGLGRDPNHVDSLSGLGWVYLLAGQQDAAGAAFEHCLSVAPQHVECLRGVASVASAKGNPALAKSQLTKALSIQPHHAGVQSSLALLDMASGNVAAALERYKVLVDREPERAEFRLGLAEALLRARRYEDALLEIDKGLPADAGPKRTRAMLLQTQSRTRVAAASERFDPENCVTAEPSLAWLTAAETAVQLAEEVEVSLPDLPVVKRRVRRQRARIAAACPK